MTFQVRQDLQFLEKFWSIKWSADRGLKEKPKYYASLWLSCIQPKAINLSRKTRS